MFRHSSIFRSTALSVIVSLLTLPFAGCKFNPEFEEGLVTAKGQGGEGCAFIQGNGGGNAWSEQGIVSVPEDAEKLIIGSFADADNADLENAEIKLTSPDGSQSLVLANGKVNAVGFSEVDMTTPIIDQTINDYYQDVLLRDLSDQATEEDWEELLSRLQGYAPENPIEDIPENVLEGLDDAITEMKQYKDTITFASEECKPSNGLIVFGPQAGNWKIEASSQSGAGAFQSLIWTVPKDGDSTAIDHIAEALAEQTGGTRLSSRVGTGEGEDPKGARHLVQFGYPNPRTTAVGPGPGEGEDPEGTWHLEQFRYPDPSTADFYRAQAIDTSYRIVQWFVLRGIFTKAIDVVLTLEGNATLIGMGLFKERLKVLAIFVVAMIYRELLRNAALAELWYWRLAYTMNSVENFFQIFYLGQIVQTGIVERTVFKIPDIVLGPNDFEEIRLVGGNMVKEAVERDMWGFGSANTRPKNGKWQIDPEDLALVKPHGQQDGDCTIETIAGQTVMGEGNLTIMIATQPAKDVIPVKIQEEKVIASTRGEIWGPYTNQQGDQWVTRVGGDVIAVWKGEKRTYTAILHKPDADPVTRTYPPEALYDQEDVKAQHWGDNVWNLSDTDICICFLSYNISGLASGSPEDALNNFLRKHPNWEQEIVNAFPYYLEWWIEIIE